MIVGDVMVDSYLWGVVDRVSPEAPVPVVDVSHREERLGGAANVAVNIKALGAEAFLCSVIGTDTKGYVFNRIMKEEALSSEGILSSDDRITTTKLRIIGNNSQMLRIDEEHTHDLNESDETAFLELCVGIMEKGMDVMIIQDYNKGILSPRIIEQLIENARRQNIPIVVDPKKKNFDLYKNVTLFKPNLKELKEGLKIDFHEPEEDILNETVGFLHEKLHTRIALITLSEYGIFISSEDNGKYESHHLPAHTRNIADVSGAGDTVVSVASLCLTVGASLRDIAAISNLAGGIVCEKVGVVPIHKEQLFDEVD